MRLILHFLTIMVGLKNPEKNNPICNPLQAAILLLLIERLKPHVAAMETSMNVTFLKSNGEKNWGLVIAVPLCFVLAIVFIASSLATSIQQPTVEALEPDWYTPKTARGEELDNKVMVGNCFLCHAYWVGVPDPEVVRPSFAHHVIKLDHGANDRCYNCHLIQDRNKYSANDGSGIMPVNVEQVCARCHGLIYKDWQAGTHGVRRGKWSSQTEFEVQTFTCTECHDPHSPKFKFKEYAPPPVWPETFVRRSAGGLKHIVASE